MNERVDQAELQNPEHGLPENFGAGWPGRLLFWLAVAFSTFQIVTAFGVPLDRTIAFGVTPLALAWAALAAGALFVGWAAARRRPVLDGLFAVVTLAITVGLVTKFPGGLPSQVVRTLHVGFLCLVGGGLLANHRSRTRATRRSGWALAVAGFLIGAYQWAFYDALVARAGELTDADLYVGLALIALLFYFVARIMGPALVIVAGAFLAYCLLGQYLPAPLNHRGYGLEQVVEHMAFGTEGIYGTPVYVSSTYIFLFVLFGAFLERAGMIALFTDIAMSLFGSARGGPAKVAVFSSALMGTISGSGVANVVAVGQFTIPLMKRFGYKPAFAGGVEATASMGGQIMPPVMGAVAFIMAETIDVPYVEIVKAAIIPALLYYLSAFLAVHFEAGRRGLVGLPRGELPSAKAALRERWFLILPLAVLVYLLFAGYTPLFAGSVGLALTVTLILGGTIALGFGREAVRVDLLRHARPDRRRCALGRRHARPGARPGHGGRQPAHPRRARDPRRLPQRARRRRPASPSGRSGLRGRRPRDRHDDADRRRDDLRQLRRVGRPELARRVPRPDDGGEPDPRHGHPDDPQLHHHLLARGALAPDARRAADRQPHVRVLLRHHGGPDAARCARLLRGGADRARERLQDQPGGDPDCAARLRGAVHGRLRSRADGAEHHRNRAAPPSRPPSPTCA